jgi:hypothetical protein
MPHWPIEMPKVQKELSIVPHDSGMSAKPDLTDPSRYPKVQWFALKIGRLGHGAKARRLAVGMRARGAKGSGASRSRASR